MASVLCYEIFEPAKLYAASSISVPVYNIAVTIYKPLNIASNYEQIRVKQFIKNMAVGTLVFIFAIVLVAYIIARRQAAKALFDLAFHDPLTKLPNRRLLMDRLSQSTKLAARENVHNALLFIDLDNFKQVNDSCGHQGGDTLLQRVAFDISSCVRAVDTVSRLSGDEFVVLLVGLSEDKIIAERNAIAVAEKISAKLNEPHNIQCDTGISHDFMCPGSIGLHVFSGATSVSDAMRAADDAMYRAKGRGKNLIEVG